MSCLITLHGERYRFEMTLFWYYWEPNEDAPIIVIHGTGCRGRGVAN